VLRHRLRLAVWLGVLGSFLAPGTASAGSFQVVGPFMVYDGNDGVDQLAGFEMETTIRFTRFGGEQLGAGDDTCTESPDGQSVECPKESVTAVILNLRGGNDVASASPSLTIPVTFNGGSGDDGLFGGGALDVFNGGVGDDNLVARDGRPEQVNCGVGTDTAITDDTDSRVSCEEVEGDADGDGVRRPADCDDTRPTIRPGATDVVENGVDEDCSGTDAVNVDRDGDGSARPLDCNDADPAIRPGATEVVGNGTDENCDTEIVPLSPITGSLMNSWRGVGSRTRNVRLAATGFPRGTQIDMRCSGARCPFRVVRRQVRSARRAVSLRGPLRNRALPAGTRIQVRFRLRNRVGRVLRFRMRSAGVPDVQFLCQDPGGKIRNC
jgi:Putative metal-binding motif